MTMSTNNHYYEKILIQFNKQIPYTDKSTSNSKAPSPPFVYATACTRV